MEQQVHFKNNLEWWDEGEQSLLQGPPPEATDEEDVVPALRLGFRGYYDAEEDDFLGETFFLSPELDEGKHEPLWLKDKCMCGFLYLRTLRTGNRALSLDRGSLLDVILKLREMKPRIGSNVNQIVKRMNQNGSLYMADVTRVKKLLHKIWLSERRLLLKMR